MDLSGFNAWGIVSVVSVLLIALILANMLKRRIPFIKKSLIPTSVLAGTIILIVLTTIKRIIKIVVIIIKKEINRGDSLLKNRIY